MQDVSVDFESPFYLATGRNRTGRVAFLWVVSVQCIFANPIKHHGHNGHPMLTFPTPRSKRSTWNTIAWVEGPKSSQSTLSPPSNLWGSDLKMSLHATGIMVFPAVLPASIPCQKRVKFT